jgi:type I restriction-modification system DNA methylase subunit
MLNKLTRFSSEHLFEQCCDFYATLFEYLIKDYNKDNGGKYAGYYTRMRWPPSWPPSWCLRPNAAR